MLPAILTFDGWRVFILGRGPAAIRRLAQAEEAGATDITVFCPGADSEMQTAARGRLEERWPRAEDWDGARLALIAGEGQDVSAALAREARQRRVLVNVEDVPPLCDFHMPSVVRRGDLLITVSTGGKSPALARALRQKLEDEFGPEWGERMKVLADMRAGWRGKGEDLAATSAKTIDFMKRNGWLK